DRLRREAPGVEAPPPATRDPAADLPDPAAGDRQGARRVPRLSLVARAHSRAPVRGHPGALRRGVRSGLRGDRLDRLGPPDGYGLAVKLGPSRPVRPVPTRSP